MERVMTQKSSCLLREGLYGGISLLVLGFNFCILWPATFLNSNPGVSVITGIVSIPIGAIGVIGLIRFIGVVRNSKS